MSALKPDFRVTLDGADLTDKLRPRLVSLSLTDKRGEEADQLDIVLDDMDGRLALPKPDAELTVAIGWPGALVEKGRFRVDEVEHTGPPDLVSIRARAADFTSDLAQRRVKAWKATTIGAIVRELAGRNGLTPACAPALASIAVKARSQDRVSDLAFLRKLGREHDAVATIKNGKLILSPIGAGETASGKPLPAIEIRRRDGDSHSWRIARREEAEGVTAQWHDRKGGKRQEVTVGGQNGSGKRLGRVFPTEAAARTAAEAEARRSARQPVELDLTLALGRSEIAPEQRATVVDFKSGIDGEYLIAEVQHSVSDRGFTTKLKLERV